MGGSAVAACAGAVAACGDGGSGTTAATTTPPERNDPAARVPHGWSRLVNRRAGFSVAIPPGWRASGARGATLVRSGDRLLAVTITADRSPDGRRLRPSVYAERLVRALPGYRRLTVARPVPVHRAHYPAASVSARGVFRRTHVRQAIRAVVLQRRDQATYALVFFRKATAPGALYAPAEAGMVQTFRARKPG